jgi:serine/threonine protein kinase
VSVPSRLGRYRLLEVLGEAGIGTTYRGHDDTIGRDVWVKVLPAAQGQDPEIRRRFCRQAQVTAQLVHRNVIAALDLAEHEGILFLTFDGLEGRSLRDALSVGISLRESVPVVLQVLDALEFVHSAGVVHRDIKPENVFICTDGLVKIINFDLAQLAPGATSVSGVIVGTPQDISPEQMTGSRTDGRSDLFSVGCTLYECVTGRSPFASGSIMETFYKVAHADPEMVSIPDGAEWAGLRRVILRALQKRPEDRYPDARAMSAELRPALSELGDSADWTARAPDTLPRPTLILGQPPSSGRPAG